MNISHVFTSVAVSMFQVGVVISERPEVGPGKPVQEANRDFG